MADENPITFSEVGGVLCCSDPAVSSTAGSHHNHLLLLTIQTYETYIDIINYL